MFLRISYVYCRNMFFNMFALLLRMSHICFRICVCFVADLHRFIQDVTCFIQVLFRLYCVLFRISCLFLRKWMFIGLTFALQWQNLRCEALFQARKDIEAVMMIIQMLGSPPQPFWRQLPFWSDAFESLPSTLRHNKVLTDRLGMQGLILFFPQFHLGGWAVFSEV